MVVFTSYLLNGMFLFHLAPSGGYVGNEGLQPRRSLLQRKCKVMLCKRNVSHCSRNPTWDLFRLSFHTYCDVFPSKHNHHRILIFLSPAHLLCGPQVPEADQGGWHHLHGFQGNLQGHGHQAASPRPAKVFRGKGGVCTLFFCNYSVCNLVAQIQGH